MQYTNTYIHTSICICAYAHIHTHVHAHTHIHAWTYVSHLFPENGMRGMRVMLKTMTQFTNDCIYIYIYLYIYGTVIQYRSLFDVPRPDFEENQHCFDRATSCLTLYSFKQFKFSSVPNTCTFPDSKVHVANMGSTWVLSAPGGPHVGPMNLVIRVALPTPVVQLSHINSDTDLGTIIDVWCSFY